MSESCSILIVDDDPAACTSLCDVLEAKGHRVETASSGHDALAACAARAVDLLLLDLTLPDMSGLDLITRVEKILPQVDVLVTTGDASMASATQVVRRSTVGYLVKPVDLDRLLAIIDQIARHMEVMTTGFLPEKYGLAQSYQVLFLFEEICLARSIMTWFSEVVPPVWHEYFLFCLAGDVLLDPVGSWYRAN